MFTILPDPDNLPAEMLSLMIRMHAQSRPLAALPPGKRLGGDKLLAWRAATQLEATLLATSLDKWKSGPRTVDVELELLNAVVSLLSLPASSLIPITGLSPAHGIINIEIDNAIGVPVDLHLEPIDLGPVPPKKAALPTIFNNIHLGGVDLYSPDGSASAEVHAAANYLRKDRQPTASKILCSNGTPPRSRQVADELTDQQFQRTEPLLFHPPDHLSLRVAFDDTTAQAGGHLCRSRPKVRN
jgi:hypothetical protein